MKKLFLLSGLFLAFTLSTNATILNSSKHLSVTVSKTSHIKNYDAAKKKVKKPSPLRLEVYTSVEFTYCTDGSTAVVILWEVIDAENRYYDCGCIYLTPPCGEANP